MRVTRFVLLFHRQLAGSWFGQLGFLFNRNYTLLLTNNFLLATLYPIVDSSAELKYLDIVTFGRYWQVKSSVFKYSVCNWQYFLQFWQIFWFLSSETQPASEDYEIKTTHSRSNFSTFSKTWRIRTAFPVWKTLE